jgi:anti-sigma regulatory factor (Ser/Thr protein kinase)
MTAEADEVEIEVAAAPTAARQARRALAGQGFVVDEPTLMLLVSELVSNSVRHAGLTEHEPIRLRARQQSDCTHVEVCDARRAGTTPHIRETRFDSLQPGGLGLQLVDAMADRWGVRCHDDEMCVWFELDAVA